MKGNARTSLLLVLLIFARSAAADNGTSASPPSRSPPSAGPDVHTALVSAALAFSPPYTLPVLASDGQPLAIESDLNGDGAPDLAFLTVLAEPGVETNYDELRRTARLFGRDTDWPLFFVETFFADSEAIQVVELDRRPGLGQMDLVPLSAGSPLPAAVVVRTRSATDRAADLLVYSAGGVIHRQQLHETERERYRLSDIDGDGVIDIVTTRRVPEAGRGYETFVEMLTLIDGSYHPGPSFALVRELQAFLAATDQDIMAGRWEQLTARVRWPPDSPLAPLSDVFMPVGTEGEDSPPQFDYPETGASVSRVVFPAILDNPFPYPYLGTTFSLEFRIERGDAPPALYAATIELSSNPFQSPRFTFLTREGTRQ